MADPQSYTVEDLGKAIKQKHPGQYDDVPDTDLGAAIKSKYPDAYKDFGGGNPAPPPGPPLSVTPGKGAIPSAPPPGPPRSAYTDFVTNRLTGKEWAGMAIDALPVVGAGTAAALGPPGWAAGLGMAALGGGVGQAVRHGVVAAVGPENLSGPHTQVEPPPSDPMDFAIDVATEGGKQALYELGGRALSGLIGGPLYAGGAKAENEAIKQISKKYNLGLTAGQVAPNLATRTTEEFGKYGLLSRGYVQNKIAKSAEAGLSAINQTLSRLYPPTSPAQMGQSTQGMLRMSKDLWSQEASKLYWNLDQQAQGVMVDMTSVKGFAAAKLQEDATEKLLHPHAGYGPKTITMLQDAAKQPDAIPFRNAHNWRSFLMKVTPQPNELLAGETPGMAKQLVRDITGTMDASSKALNPTANKLWTEARQFYKDGAQLFDHETITGLMKKEPAEVAGAIKPKIGDTDTAARIRSAILDYPMKYGNPDEQQEAKFAWRQFQEQFVRSRLLEDPEHVGDGMTAQRLGAIKDKINEFGPGVMGEIFGKDAEGKEVLKNLTDLGEAFSRIGKLPDQLRMVAFRFLESGGVALTGPLNHPVASFGTLTALEVLPQLVVGVVYSKKATAYMLDGLRGITEEALKIKPTSLVGKASIKITGAANAPSKAFAKATANIARAATLVYEDREKIREEVESAKQEKAGPPKLPAGPPNKLDLFKDWQ